MKFEDVDPQLDAEDLDDIVASRLELMAKRVEPIEFVYREQAAGDSFFDLPTGSTKKVTVSGVVQAIREEDRLLRLGGRVKAGDLKVILYREHADLVGDLDAIRGATVVRPPSAGSEYLVDVAEEVGIGRPNRVELGLVLKK